MRKWKRRGISFLLTVCLLLCNVCLFTRASNPAGVEYLNTHVNTGNQRLDIVSVALTQVGYREKDVNDTKYGDWYGLPKHEWCAMFVSWCARQAEISNDILKKHCWASPYSFGVSYYSGEKYTPKPGDLFFTKGFTHVGIVWYVEGSYFHTIEGNAKEHNWTAGEEGSSESYYVLSNKRITRNYYFGVPKYEGCDKDHTYVRECEAEHPHNVYYRCTTCGDQYYTGYSECVANCPSCLSCGCTSAQSGYYVVTSGNGPVRLRSKHSTQASLDGYATEGEVVYVHGTDPEGGWAYIEYDGERGHVPLSNLTPHYGIPETPQVHTEREDYVINEDVTLNWVASTAAEQYRLKIYYNGQFQTEVWQNATSYTMPVHAAGEYTVEVIACNIAGFSEKGIVRFSVLDAHSITYDATGGYGAPEPHTQVAPISSKVPTREGYTFLGWATEPHGRIARYRPGDTLNLNDIILYAVWKENGAQPHALSVTQMPTCTLYVPGESLNTSGLVLRLMYSDGSGQLVSEGFTAEGFETETTGQKTVTVTHSGLKTTFAVEVRAYREGDIDQNRVVDRDDVMLLLWHISFPKEFPITIPADFNQDGAVNRDDVMQLLWHITFPEQFPLKTG